MNYKIQIYIGLLLLLTLSCDNDDDPSGDETLFFWNQTKCGDPWNTGENNSNVETETAVTEFLENENVTVISLNFDTNSPLDIHCESCGCGTGQRIIVGVMQTDSSRMEELEFYQ